MDTKKILLLVLILAAASAQAFQYIRIVDLTDHNYRLVDVYQNDGVSLRYIKTIELNNTEMQTIGTSNNYTLIIQPEIRSITSNPGNSKYINYVVNMIPVYGMFFIAVLLIIYIYRGTKNA